MSRSHRRRLDRLVERLEWRNQFAEPDLRVCNIVARVNDQPTVVETVRSEMIDGKRVELHEVLIPLDQRDPPFKQDYWDEPERIEAEPEPVTTEPDAPLAEPIAQVETAHQEEPAKPQAPKLSENRQLIERWLSLPDRL